MLLVAVACRHLVLTCQEDGHLVQSRHQAHEALQNRRDTCRAPRSTHPPPGFMLACQLRVCQVGGNPTTGGRKQARPAVPASHPKHSRCDALQACWRGCPAESQPLTHQKFTVIDPQPRHACNRQLGINQSQGLQGLHRSCRLAAGAAADVGGDGGGAWPRQSLPAGCCCKGAAEWQTVQGSSIS